MRKLLLAGACALALSSLVGCSSQELTTLGTDLGVLAADLPTACGNLIAAQTAVAGLSGIPANLKTALTNGNAVLTQYCGPAAVAVSDAQVAIGAVQAATQSITAAQSGN
jgi:hypothetical protein